MTASNLRPLKVYTVEYTYTKQSLCTSIFFLLFGGKEPIRHSLYFLFDSSKYLDIQPA